MANVARLRRTLEHIKANPEQWNQNSWPSCFAGWTVRLEMGDRMTAKERPAACSCCGPYMMLEVDGVPFEDEDIELRARQLLELKYDDADELFYSGNTMDDLESMVASLTRVSAIPAG